MKSILCPYEKKKCHTESNTLTQYHILNYICLEKKERKQTHHFTVYVFTGRIAIQKS